MLLRRRSLLAGAAGFTLGASCAHDDDAVKYETSSKRRTRDGVVHIGNSTHLIVLDGVHVLTDPWLKDPADKVLQHRVLPDALPVDIDLLLLTHEHEDHFDPVALALLDKKCTVVAPTWLVDRTKALGFTDVRGVKAGDQLADVRGFVVDVVKGAHDVEEVLYRFGRNDGPKVFFAGDTLPNPELTAFAKAGADFCFLPADAGALMGKRFVMNVEEAVALGEAFGVNASGKGAMLTHHEFELTSSVWSVILDVKPVDTSKLPSWFAAPTPGQQFLFPWMDP